MELKEARTSKSKFDDAEFDEDGEMQVVPVAGTTTDQTGTEPQAQNSQGLKSTPEGQVIEISPQQQIQLQFQAD